MPSFDVSAEMDWQELDNAINQATKELQQRYDFKGIKTEIKLDDHLTVGNSQHVKIGGSQLVEAGREIHIKAGEKVVIEAGLELTLKAGGSFIKLDPGGVTVLGSQILLNAGGLPGSGSGYEHGLCR